MLLIYGFSNSAISLYTVTFDKMEAQYISRTLSFDCDCRNIPHLETIFLDADDENYINIYAWSSIKWQARRDLDPNCFSIGDVVF